MSSLVESARDRLVENVVELAEAEADILVRLARWRPPGQDRQACPFGSDALTAQRVVHWSREIAEALIRSERIAGSGRGTASRLWSRVRAVIMMFKPNWNVDEFILFHLTRDQYCGFPYGLAVSDLIRFADGDFPPSRIRSAMRRLARRELIKPCHTKRSRPRPHSRLPTRESLWFYSGPSSKYAEDPERFTFMHTPWDQRPSEAE